MVEILDTVRGIFCDALRALDDVDFASRQGKVFSLMKERLIDAHINAQICVKDASIRADPDKHEVIVCLLSTEPLSPDSRLCVYRLISAVQRRYGLILHAQFVNSPERKIGIE